MTSYKPKVGDILYRYEPMPSMDLFAPEIDNNYLEFRVTKLTPCGCWVTHNTEYLDGFSKYVSNNATKRYAHYNKRDALYSYIRRKRKHIAILENKVADLKVFLANAERVYNGDTT